MKLKLSEAVRLALDQNRALKIARLKVVESEQKKTAAKSNYFPEIKNQSAAGHTTAEGNIEIPAGAFGEIRNAGLVPNRDILINQGSLSFVTSGTTAAATSDTSDPYPPGEPDCGIDSGRLARRTEEGGERGGFEGSRSVLRHPDRTPAEASRRAGQRFLADPPSRERRRCTQRKRA